jgi:dihydropyrimidinase
MELGMLDLAVTGGTVVTEQGTLAATVGVKDGRVVAIAAPGAVTDDAAETVDATGMFVVPGGIDAHVHFNLKVTDAMNAQSAVDGSKAAAFGGTTTFMDFALQAGEGSAVEAVEAKQRELAAQRPNVDYALHLMLTGAVGFEVMEELPDLVAGGVSSFKMFTTFSGASASGDLFSDDGRIWGVMEQAERAGGIVMVHCEDDCIIDYNVRRLYRAGLQDGRNIYQARPPLAEEAAIRRMILLARRSGSPLYVVHVSSTWGVEAIREARASRLPVYGEVLHNYLVFTSDDYAAEEGLLYHNYPPLKSKADRERLWASIVAGDLDTVASDDFTIPKAAKLSGPWVDNVPGGHNGVETRMDVLFSEGVASKRLPIEQYARVTSTNPAKLFGIYPRKGTIAVGSDADLVLIDPAWRGQLRLEDLHSACDYSLWDGWRLDGRVRTTILRGMPIVRDGQWVGPRGAGRFVPSSALRAP